MDGGYDRSSVRDMACDHPEIGHGRSIAIHARKLRGGGRIRIVQTPLPGLVGHANMNHARPAIAPASRCRAGSHIIRPTIRKAAQRNSSAGRTPFTNPSKTNAIKTSKCDPIEI